MPPMRKEAFPAVLRCPKLNTFGSGLGLSKALPKKSTFETRMNNGLFVVTEYPDVETWHCHV